MVVLSLHIDHVLGALPKKHWKSKGFREVFFVLTGFPGPFIKKRNMLYTHSGVKLTWFGSDE